MLVGVYRVSVMQDFYHQQQYHAGFLSSTVVVPASRASPGGLPWQTEQAELPSKLHRTTEPLRLLQVNVVQLEACVKSQHITSRTRDQGCLSSAMIVFVFNTHMRYALYWQLANNVAKDHLSINILHVGS